MKNYIKPEMTLSMFDIETISTTEELDTNANVVSAAYTTNLQNYINKNQNAVQRNVNFNDALKFN